MTETDAIDEAFADDTPLVALCGDGARPKLLSVVVDERERDLNVSELARQAGVERSTVYDHLDALLELGVVEETRETGNSQRYQLAADDPVAQRLYELDGLVLRRLLDGADVESTDEA